MRIGSPLYLVESREPCWKCHQPQRVIALATARVDDDDMNTMDGGPENESLLFKNVESLDPVLELWLATHEPHYRRHFSKNAGMEYFANLCPGCGANCGDHFLHEAGGAFFPMGPEEAALMSLVELPLEGEFEMEADWVMGAGNLLLEYAQRR